MDENIKKGAIPKKIRQVPRNDWRSRSTKNNENSMQFQKFNALYQSNGNPNNFNKKQNRPFEVKRFQFGFKKLEELASKEPDAIIISLASERIGFEHLLEGKLSGDYIVLVLKVLSKMCDSNFNENKALILAMATKVSFIDNLINYLLQLMMQDEQEKRRNLHFWRNVDEFFSNFTKYCQTIIEKVPNIACEGLPKLLKAVNIMTPTFEIQHDVVIPEKIKQSFEDIQHKLDLIVENYNTKKTSNKAPEEEEPPDDFHEISIYPTSEELMIRERSFVRENIRKGAYRNVHHYLDVQFRLLREDFVGPLRKAVLNYMNPNTNSRLENVRLHRKVQFQEKTVTSREVGIFLQYTFSKKIRNLEHTKRFMFGSLLCFANSNLSAIFFGKVVDRSSIKNGHIVVVLNDNFKDFKIYTDYIMFECSIFFEPYYQVLKGLKNMNDENFPLEKYLIKTDTESELPEYVTEDASLTTRLGNFLILGREWPKKECFGLNESQYVAMQNALRQKLVLIQGPPGTGKTYLGLKLAKILIENKRMWFKQKPILVICYTNHALDQFLMGLMGTTNKIIRFGGQCKNEELKKFSLSNARKSIVHFDTRATGTLLFHQRTEVAEKMDEIRMLNSYVAAIAAHEGIVKINGLDMLDKDIRNTWFSRASNKDLVNWLMLGYTFKKNASAEKMVVVSNFVLLDGLFFIIILIAVCT